MYENSKSSIDWKGLFLKVIIAFLIVIIAVTAFKTFNGKSENNSKTTTEAIVESNASSTFTENIAKLKEAGEKYYTENKDKLPKTEGNTSIVTLSELITNGTINNLSDEDGKTCDGESSYVTAMLEGKQIKLKANLVCGESSSYSLVYMGENDSEVEEEKTNATNSSNTKNTSTSKNTSISKNTSTSKSTSTTSTNCSNSSCTPNVSVNTNTNVSQNVSINTSDNNANETEKNNASNSATNQTTNNTSSSTNNRKYYTVSFDRNGGTKYFRSQEVAKNDVANDPGDNYKSGYKFKGWYLDNELFDFDTPITEDITLIAKYTKKTNYENEYENEYEYNNLVTRTYTSSVYTMGWDSYYANEINVSHTLRLPEYLENKDIERVKIKDINFSKSINTASLARSYENNHADTFIYSRNGWESNNTNVGSLATIKSADVEFYYNTGYKTMNNALDNGFDVSWNADRVSKKCTSPFSVNGVTNLCNYGIVYKVTWQYQIYE